MQLDFGVNAGFVEELYARYVENPESVDPGWRAFFEQRGDGGAAVPAAPAIVQARPRANRSSCMGPIYPLQVRAGAGTADRPTSCAGPTNAA
ncbi:MAG: hypothetical protein IT372_07850 [Polyangiaceae bacterium]|nr:hypothetical protein [Polyangiaceae bacterium]